MIIILFFVFLPAITFGLIGLRYLRRKNYRATGATSLIWAAISGLWLYSSIQEMNEFTGMIVVGAFIYSFVFGFSLIGVAALINNLLRKKNSQPEHGADAERRTE